MLGTSNNIIATKVEFATSVISKIRGLMFTKSIDSDYALVFPLTTPRKVKVHMHFVKFPLDVMLLNECKRIIQMDTLEAGTGKMASFSDVSYIVEMKSGTIRKYGIEIGDILIID